MPFSEVERPAERPGTETVGAGASKAVTGELAEGRDIAALLSGARFSAAAGRWRIKYSAPPQISAKTAKLVNNSRRDMRWTGAVKTGAATHGPEAALDAPAGGA